MEGKISKALDLFSRCVQDLVDRDDFEMIYLHDIKMYVTSALICENLRLQSEREPKLKRDYNSFKKVVNKHAKDCGYPKLEDLDKPPVIETKKAFTGLKIVR